MRKSDNFVEVIAHIHLIVFFFLIFLFFAGIVSLVCAQLLFVANLVYSALKVKNMGP
jgi:hypothetical protein